MYYYSRIILAVVVGIIEYFTHQVPTFVMLSLSCAISWMRSLRWMIAHRERSLRPTKDFQKEEKQYLLHLHLQFHYQHHSSSSSSSWLPPPLSVSSFFSNVGDSSLHYSYPLTSTVGSEQHERSEMHSESSAFFNNLNFLGEDFIVGGLGSRIIGLCIILLWFLHV